MMEDWFTILLLVAASFWMWYLDKRVDELEAQIKGGPKHE